MERTEGDEEYWRKEVRELLAELPDVWGKFTPEQRADVSKVLARAILATGREMAPDVRAKLERLAVD